MVVMLKTVIDTTIPLLELVTELATEGTFSCMKAAYDAGINFFDCAEGYAGGESEKVMGEAIKKFGYLMLSSVLVTLPADLFLQLETERPCNFYKDLLGRSQWRDQGEQWWLVTKAYC